MSLNIYNPTTQQLTEVAGLDVKDSLEKVATLPTPTADYLNQVYILVGTQEGYHVGSIYQCRYINSAYTWVEITGSVVGKADKAPNATNNHLAKLTADGNLADSGIAVGDLGTAINKNWTDLVRPNSHDLVESNAVYSAITNAISSIYTPHGDITCAELVPALLIDENIGNVYTVTDSGTTTAYFMQGAGKTINTGDSVSIIKAGATEILFNLMGNVLDLTDYQKKNLTTPLTIGGTTQTTVEGALGGLNTKETDDIEGIWKANNVLGAKNVFPVTRPSTTTNTGVTFTVNSDGSVTANGTASADTWFQLCDGFKLKDVEYTLTGCPSGGSSTTYELQFRSIESSSSQWQMVNDYGNGKTATGDSTRTYIGFVGIHSGYTATNLTFYPMIRLTSDPDSTYVPYSRTNQELTGEVVPMLNILGAKNVLPNKLVPKTTSGVVYSVNSDGTINMHGTNTSGSWVSNNFCDFDTLKNVLSQFKGKRMIFSITSNYDFDTNNICLYYNIGGTSTYITPNPREAEFVVPNNIDTATSITVPIGVNGNKTANTYNLGIMLRPASIQDSTYEPYAMTNQQLTPYAQSISNPNLFDNPWFTVNQRELTTYTTPTSGRKYTVDRWSINIHLSATVDSNGITLTSDNSGINGDLRHGFENSMYPFLVNRLATLSAKLSDGTIYSISGIINPAQIGTIRLPLKDGWKIDINTGSNGTIAAYIFSDINNPNSSITIRAVKLELGGVSTLAMDTAPNYATELLKCQRYFVRFGEGSTFLGFVNNSTTMYGTITVPVKMRIDNPSVTKTGTILMNWTGHAGSSGEALDTFTAYGSKSNVFSFGATIASSSLTAGQCAEINVRTDAYIDFSADP